MSGIHGAARVLLAFYILSVDMISLDVMCNLEEIEFVKHTSVDDS